MALLFNLGFMVFLVMFVQVHSIIIQFGADQTDMCSALTLGVTLAGMTYKAVFEEMIALDAVSLQVMFSHVTGHSFPIGSSEYTILASHKRCFTLSERIVVIMA